MARVHAPENPLIGRDAEVTTVAAALAHCRILTLTGPPGVGKTRLAIEVAARSGDHFPDGVALVALSRVASPELALQEIGRAVLGSSASCTTAAQVVEYVGRRSLLLVLDDLDRVVDVGPDLAQLIGACPHLRLLATSRERLHLAVEHEFPVPPLAMPSGDEASRPARLLDVPSVQLLVARARAVVPDFVVDAGNAEAVAALCAGLDGLPLAYELMAPNLKAFSARELVARLGDRFALLARGPRDVAERHRALRTAIAWSHDLLTPPLRALFRRSAVFAGPWTVADAQAVCAPPEEIPGWDVPEMALALVDRSLLKAVRRTDGATGYVMLDSIRDFATEMLEQSGEADGTRARHAEHFAQLAMEAEARIATDAEDAAIAWLAEERPNLATACTRALAHEDIEAAAWLAAGSGWAAYTTGSPADETLALLLRIDSGAASPSAQGAVLTAQGILDCDRGMLDDAAAHLTIAEQLSLVAGDARRVAINHAFLGHVARHRGHHGAAAEHYDEAARHFEAVGNARGRAWSRHDLGLLARDSDEAGRAVELLQQSLDDFRDLGYPWATACVALTLGELLAAGVPGGPAARRRTDDGVDLVLLALELFRACGDGRGLARTLEAVAGVAAARGDLPAAGLLLGAGARLHPPGIDVSAGRRPFADVRRSVRAALGDRRAEELRRAGAALPLAEVLELAGKVAAAPPLTHREQQVASLLAHGSTNRQVGRSLGITERTVETHVAHIMAKLGAGSRAEIAAWAARQGLGASP